MNWAATFAIGVHAVAVWLLYLAAMRFIGAGLQTAWQDAARNSDDAAAWVIARRLGNENVIVGSALMALAFAGVVLMEVAL